MALSDVRVRKAELELAQSSGFPQDTGGSGLYSASQIFPTLALISQDSSCIQEDLGCGVRLRTTAVAVYVEEGSVSVFTLLPLLSLLKRGCRAQAEALGEPHQPDP